MLSPPEHLSGGGVECNCGSCGLVCPPGNRCDTGVCSLSCQAGLTSCGEVCRDTQTDVANCGGCGNACTELAVCTAGACDFRFRVAQVIDGELVTCSSVLYNADPAYTECRDLQQGGRSFSNGITCGPVFSFSNSLTSDTIGFCLALTGTAKAESFFSCSGSQTRSTWRNHVWGTVSDNGFTKHLRCYH